MEMKLKEGFLKEALFGMTVEKLTCTAFMCCAGGWLMRGN